jgi:hypothetical protein
MECWASETFSSFGISSLCNTTYVEGHHFSRQFDDQEFSEHSVIKILFVSGSLINLNWARNLDSHLLHLSVSFKVVIQVISLLLF